MFNARPDRLAPGDLLEVAGCAVRLRVDGRARRISLRVDAASREVIATAPSPRRLKDAAQFAASRAEWISTALARLPEALAFEPGGTIEVLGRPCRLERTESRRGQAVVDDGNLFLVAYGEGEDFNRSATRLLKGHALKVFVERTEAHAAVLGQPLPKVSVMDARSRWGSCTPARPPYAAGIRYSWRLILAPYEVMDYVVAHECAHLVHADHSARFWNVVRSLRPDMARQRAWLRAHGSRLHAFGR
jgi:predicted metal-dependent hydrolase